ncbi:MAG: TIM barrel protein [Caldilineaceae bacterium]|nr:TIM barrel protein [Caldilineaceae bacterium]
MAGVVLTSNVVAAQNFPTKPVRIIVPFSAGGATDIVTTVDGIPMSPPREQGPPLDFLTLLRMRQQVEDAGLTLSVIEGYQLSDRIMLGQPGRDEDIDSVCQSIRHMGAAGIPIYCYNFMAVFNWLRTSTTTRTRGGALVTSYDDRLLAHAPLTYAGQTTDEEMWENFAYFLTRVVPAAEEANVKLALHPDDPPMSPVRGLARIMRSVEAFQRVFALVPSQVNGMTFCQGNFAAMGDGDVAAAIRDFGREGKIFFAHFRDVAGSVPAFQETFHNDGKTDMAATMRAYRDIGFDGPMRPDHAPTMEGEANSDPGYMVLGKLHAIGYMQGLWEAVTSEELP